MASDRSCIDRPPLAEGLEVRLEAFDTALMEV